jgi:hypothetical protein
MPETDMRANAEHRRTLQLSKVDDEHRVDTTARGVRQPLVYDSFRRVAERCPYRFVALGVGRAPPAESPIG